VVFKFQKSSKQIEIEETSMMEGHNVQAQKVQMKLEAKEKAIVKIKKQLTNFRNTQFKNEAATFIQWIIYQSDPPTMIGYQYPSDLKLYLSKVKRYEGDLEMIVNDVNEKFKNLI
jgi:hypothetical protein